MFIDEHNTRPSLESGMIPRLINEHNTRPSLESGMIPRLINEHNNRPSFESGMPIDSLMSIIVDPHLRVE